MLKKNELQSNTLEINESDIQVLQKFLNCRHFNKKFNFLHYFIDNFDLKKKELEMIWVPTNNNKQSCKKFFKRII